jgi:Tripartite ATP-independent periplasmic transporter, DctM component
MVQRHWHALPTPGRRIRLRPSLRFQVPNIFSIRPGAPRQAVCGSSLATAATMARISIPQMQQAGYARTLAAGAVAAGGTLGILIPPSLILMIYGIIAQLSVIKLFAAALLPGLGKLTQCSGTSQGMPDPAKDSPPVCEQQSSLSSGASLAPEAGPT